MEENTERRSSVVLEEWSCASTTPYITATITSTITSLTIKRSANLVNDIWGRLLKAFVPEGFPNSVTPDYMPFQLWDLLQGLSTYVRTMLSTQALLSAIGVGEKSATVIGATFQWFLRDLSGMLGGIFFTFYQGSNLDCNAKMWRLVADFMNDIGMLMDLLSPLFPSAFLFLVCLGSLSRAITGVASSATRAALTQHFAVENNAADISSKEVSQETFATIVGLGLGMLLARLTFGHPLGIWISFLFLTLFHMHANYMAVRCLQLKTLNGERTSILFQHFFETNQVLCPKQVSKREHVLPSFSNFWRSRNVRLLHKQINVGLKVSSLKHAEMMDVLRSAGSQTRKGRYILWETNGTLYVVLHKDSTGSDILRSYVHALVMAYLLDKKMAAHSKSQLWMDYNYGDFIAKLELLGWKTERLLLPSVAWRAIWTCESS